MTYFYPGVTQHARHSLSWYSSGSDMASYEGRNQPVRTPYPWSVHTVAVVHTQRSDCSPDLSDTGLSYKLFPARGTPAKLLAQRAACQGAAHGKEGSQWVSENEAAFPSALDLSNCLTSVSLSSAPAHTPSPATPLERVDSSLVRALSFRDMGLTRPQLESMMEVAQRQNIVIAARFPARHVLVHSGTAMTGKPRSLTTRTASSGPEAGLLTWPVTPSEDFCAPLPATAASTPASANIDRVSKMLQMGELKLEPLLMQKSELRRTTLMGSVVLSGQRRHSATHESLFLRRPQSGVPRYVAERRNSDSYLVKQRGEGGWNPMYVLMTREGERIVSDIDLVFVGIPKQSWDAAGADRPALTHSMLTRKASFTTLEASMDPVLGNVTEREKQIIEDLNQTLGSALIQHGPESGNPHARPENLLPCLVINPGLVPRQPFYKVLQTNAQLGAYLNTMVRHGGCRISPHPSWKEIPALDSNLYDLSMGRKKNNSKPVVFRAD